MVSKCIPKAPPPKKPIYALSEIHKKLQEFCFDSYIPRATKYPKECENIPDQPETYIFPPLPCQDWDPRTSKKCKRFVCPIKFEKKCYTLEPSWLTGADLDQYIKNSTYDGPYVARETEILKSYDVRCPYANNDCTRECPCQQCLILTIKQLIMKLGSVECDDSDSDSDSDFGICPEPEIPKPDEDPCAGILNMFENPPCPLQPIIIEQKFWLTEIGMCVFTHLKEKSDLRLCIEQEDVRPSPCWSKWKKGRKFNPPYKKPFNLILLSTYNRRKNRNYKKEHLIFNFKN